MLVFRKNFITVVFMLTLSLITSCSDGNVIDIKSPCVSLEDGPCGPKRPINDWWLKTNV